MTLDSMRPVANAALLGPTPAANMLRSGPSSLPGSSTSLADTSRGTEVPDWRPPAQHNRPPYHHSQHHPPPQSHYHRQPPSLHHQHTQPHGQHNPSHARHSPSPRQSTLSNEYTHLRSQSPALPSPRYQSRQQDAQSPSISPVSSPLPSPSASTSASASASASATPSPSPSPSSASPSSLPHRPYHRPTPTGYDSRSSPFPSPSPSPSPQNASSRHGDSFSYRSSPLSTRTQTHLYTNTYHTNHAHPLPERSHPERSQSPASLSRKPLQQRTVQGPTYHHAPLNHPQHSQQHPHPQLSQHPPESRPFPRKPPLFRLQVHNNHLSSVPSSPLSSPMSVYSNSSLANAHTSSPSPTSLRPPQPPQSRPSASSLPSESSQPSQSPQSPATSAVIKPLPSPIVENFSRPRKLSLSQQTQNHQNHGVPRQPASQHSSNSQWPSSQVPSQPHLGSISRPASPSIASIRANQTGPLADHSPYEHNPQQGKHEDRSHSVEGSPYDDKEYQDPSFYRQHVGDRDNGCADDGLRNRSDGHNANSSRIYGISQDNQIPVDRHQITYHQGRLNQHESLMKHDKSVYDSINHHQRAGTRDEQELGNSSQNADPNDGTKRESVPHSGRNGKDGNHPDRSEFYPLYQQHEQYDELPEHRPERHSQNTDLRHTPSGSTSATVDTGQLSYVSRGTISTLAETNDTEELSVDDVMCMYEQGFTDDDPDPKNLYASHTTSAWDHTMENASSTMDRMSTTMAKTMSYHERSDSVPKANLDEPSRRESSHGKKVLAVVNGDDAEPASHASRASRASHPVSHPENLSEDTSQRTSDSSRISHVPLQGPSSVSMSSMDKPDSDHESTSSRISDDRDHRSEYDGEEYKEDNEGMDSRRYHQESHNESRGRVVDPDSDEESDERYEKGSICRNVKRGSGRMSQNGDEIESAHPTSTEKINNPRDPPVIVPPLSLETSLLSLDRGSTRDDGPPPDFHMDLPSVFGPHVISSPTKSTFSLVRDSSPQPRGESGLRSMESGRTDSVRGSTTAGHPSAKTNAHIQAEENQREENGNGENQSEGNMNICEEIEDGDHHKGHQSDRDVTNLTVSKDEELRTHASSASTSSRESSLSGMGPVRQTSTMASNSTHVQPISPSQPLSQSPLPSHPHSPLPSQAHLPSSNLHVHSSHPINQQVPGSPEKQAPIPPPKSFQQQQQQQPISSPYSQAHSRTKSQSNSLYSQASVNTMASSSTAKSTKKPILKSFKPGRRADPSSFVTSPTLSVNLSTHPAAPFSPLSPSATPATTTPATTSTTSASIAHSPLASHTFAPSVSEEDLATRDRYGFLKESRSVTRQQYDEWFASYAEYLDRRQRKWYAFMKDHNLPTDNPKRFPSRNGKTLRFVRKGIPAEWRGAAWFYYAGGHEVMAQNPGKYEKLLRQEAKTIDADAIERDLHRTFPDNCYFRAPNLPSSTAQSSAEAINQAMEAHRTHEMPMITSLRRVLHAFALYHPQIGYCQSLNFLAGLLLLFEETEEHCFWLLHIITTVYLPSTHETSLEGSRVDLSVLMSLVYECLPEVWEKLSREPEDHMTPAMMATSPHPDGAAATGSSSSGTSYASSTTRSLRRGLPPRMRRGLTSSPRPSGADRLPSITLFMTQWFMNCYIGVLPMETTLRIWDIFFYEGPKTLFHVALTILKTTEPSIKAMKDPMEIFPVVQEVPRKMLDANGLIETCYRRRHGFGHITQTLVDEKRRDSRASRRLAEQKRQAGSVVNRTNASVDLDEGKRKEEEMEEDKAAAGGGRRRRLRIPKPLALPTSSFDRTRKPSLDVDADDGETSRVTPPTSLRPPHVGRRRASVDRKDAGGRPMHAAAAAGPREPRPPRRQPALGVDDDGGGGLGASPAKTHFGDILGEAGAYEGSLTESEAEPRRRLPLFRRAKRRVMAEVQ